MGFSHDGIVVTTRECDAPHRRSRPVPRNFGRSVLCVDDDGAVVHVCECGQHELVSPRARAFHARQVISLSLVIHKGFVSCVPIASHVIDECFADGRVLHGRMREGPKKTISISCHAFDVSAIPPDGPSPSSTLVRPTTPRKAHFITLYQNVCGAVHCLCVHVLCTQHERAGGVSRDRSHHATIATQSRLRLGGVGTGVDDERMISGSLIIPCCSGRSVRIDPKKISPYE